MLAIQQARFKRIEEAQKLEKQIAEATPKELAALWKAGKLDVREYNRRYPRTYRCQVIQTNRFISDHEAVGTE